MDGIFSGSNNHDSNKEGIEVSCSHPVVHRIKQTKEVYCLTCNTKLGEISDNLWNNPYKDVMDILRRNYAKVEA